VLRSSGDNAKNVALMATSGMGRRTITVLISFWRSNRDAKLTVKHLPPDWKKCTLWHYRVTESHDWEQVAFRQLPASTGVIKYLIEAPAGTRCVHVVRLAQGVNPQLALPPLGRPARWLPPGSARPLRRPVARPARPPPKRSLRPKKTRKPPARGGK